MNEEVVLGEVIHDVVDHSPAKEAGPSEIVPRSKRNILKTKPYLVLWSFAAIIVVVIGLTIAITCVASSGCSIRRANHKAFQFEPDVQCLWWQCSSNNE
jgi:hypothetical protein